jgi:MFS family permease
VRQFLIAVSALSAGLLALASISNLYLFAAVSLIAAAPMAPVIAVQSILVSRLAPKEMLAESFTWGATCLLVGISGGIAGGGVLAEYLSTQWILALAAIPPLLAGVIVRTSYRGR